MEILKGNNIHYYKKHMLTICSSSPTEWFVVRDFLTFQFGWQEELLLLLLNRNSTVLCSLITIQMISWDPFQNHSSRYVTNNREQRQKLLLLTHITLLCDVTHSNGSTLNINQMKWHKPHKIKQLLFNKNKKRYKACDVCCSFLWGKK